MVQLANLNKKQRLARLDPRFTSKLFFSLFSMVQLASLNKNRHQEAAFSVWRLSLFSMVQLANLNKNRHREAAFSTWRLSLFFMVQLANLNKNRHQEAAFSPRGVWIRVLPLNCFSLFSMQQLAEREGGVFLNEGLLLLNLATSHFHTRYIFGAWGEF